MSSSDAPIVRTGLANRRRATFGALASFSSAPSDCLNASTALRFLPVFSDKWGSGGASSANALCSSRRTKNGVEIGVEGR
jgi:hypothetical protein